MSECAKFLDEQGVKPCGHSAREKGILLKVYASCRTGQDSAELAFTTRAMFLAKDGFMYHWPSGKAQQNIVGVDFTKVRCGKGEKEECAIASDATWSTAIEVIAYRTVIVEQTYRGCPVWFTLLLDDDAEKMKDYREMTQGNKFCYNPYYYGQVIKLGWGPGGKIHHQKMHV